MIKHRISNGDHLTEVYNEEKGFITFLAKSGDIGNQNRVTALLQSTLALRGLTERPFGLHGPTWDEDKFIAEYMSAPSQALWQCWYLAAQLPVLYLGGKIPEALKNIEQALAIPLEKVIYGQYQRVDYYFFATLTKIADWENADAKTRGDYRKFIDECLGHMNIWVEKCYADSFRGREALMRAELARVEGDAYRASEL